MMNNFPLRSGKGETFEGGIRGVGLVHGSGLSSAVKGTISRQLHHVSDWYKTILSAAGADLDALSLKSNERPFIDGDGVDNWRALSEGKPSSRDEIYIAGQAESSVLQAHALRSGDWKLMWHPSLLYHMPSWYPPPGKAWNYANFTVKCGEPPSSPPFGECGNESTPCLFNISADPCEYNNLAAVHPDIVKTLKARIAELKKTTVLSWSNFAKFDDASDPKNFGPTTPITPDPQRTAGPHIYQGVWKPWLTSSDDASVYPTNYAGPGY